MFPLPAIDPNRSSLKTNNIVPPVGLRFKILIENKNRNDT